MFLVEFNENECATFETIEDCALAVYRKEPRILRVTDSVTKQNFTSEVSLFASHLKVALEELRYHTKAQLDILNQHGPDVRRLPREPEPKKRNSHCLIPIGFSRRG